LLPDMYPAIRRMKDENFNRDQEFH
jgi:hypothetical protein